MIKGFEEQTQELKPEEKALVKGFVNSLINKLGKEKAVSNRYIRQKFIEKYDVKISDARVRKIINHIRINNLVPLLCSNSKGYYVARTKKEMTDYLKGLKQRIDSQTHVYNKLVDQYKFAIENENN